MNKHLQQLIDLSIIDKEIDAFEPQIEEANYNYEAALAKTHSIESDIENLSNEIKEEELKKANIEYEKMKYLQNEEIKKELKRLKLQESRDMDEIAILLRGRDESE